MVGPGFLKRLAQAVVALAVTGVAACDEVPQTVVTFMRPGGTWAFFDYATSRGPLLVQVLTVPSGFAPEAVSAQAGAAVTRAIQRKVIATTADPSQAAAPDYRLVFAFDLPTSTAPERLCDGTRLEPQGDPATIRVIGAFCHKTEVHASATGTVPRRSSEGGGALGEMIAQMTRGLIVEDTAR